MVQFNIQFRKIVDDFLQKIEFGAVQKDVESFGFHFFTKIK